MTDSQFLYQLMLRVNDARANRPHTSMTMSALLAEVTGLQREIESGASIERMREQAIDVAAYALRLAVETLKERPHPVAGTFHG